MSAYNMNPNMYIDPHIGRDNQRSMMRVRMDEIHANPYLRRCKVLHHDHMTNEVTMFYDEVEMARREFERNQRSMYGIAGTTQIAYDHRGHPVVDYSHYYDTATKPPKDGKEEEKKKKHASNLMKCYWAHYQKNKELTL